MLDQSASASSAYPSLDLPCGRHVTLEFLLVTGLIDFTLVGFGGWVEHTSLRHLDRMNTITYAIGCHEWGEGMDSKVRYAPLLRGYNFPVFGEQR